MLKVPFPNVSFIFLVLQVSVCYVSWLHEAWGWCFALMDCNFLLWAHLQRGSFPKEPCSLSRILEASLLSSFILASTGVVSLGLILKWSHSLEFSWVGQAVGLLTCAEAQRHTASLKTEVTFLLLVTSGYHPAPKSCDLFVFCFYRLPRLSFIFNLSSRRFPQPCFWTWLCIYIACCYMTANVFICSDCGLGGVDGLSVSAWSTLLTAHLRIKSCHSYGYFYDQKRSRVSHQK